APAIDPATGTLTYTPAADANGTAVVTVRLRDDGGTDRGGQDTSAAQTFTITVNPANDAPSFTKGADQAVDEDTGPQAVPAWATGIRAGPANEASQHLTFLVSTDNPGLFAVEPAIDPATGSLTHTPAPDAHGAAVVTGRLRDGGGTDRGGQDTSAAQTFTITVNPVNDAPVPVNDSATTDEDTSATIDVLANDRTGPGNESGQALAVTRLNGVAAT